MSNVVINNKTITVNPLTLRHIRKMMCKGSAHNAALSGISGGLLTDEQFDALLDVAIWGIEQNHPDLTKEWLNQYARLPELNGLLMAILQESGLVQVEPDPKTATKP